MLFAGVFSSCIKIENPSNSLDLTQKKENDLYHYAKIENASDYSNVVEVVLMVYDRSINRYVELERCELKDGGFTILLPKILDPNYLYTIINNSELQVSIIDTSTVIICNKNIKVGNASFWGVNKDGNVVTCFSPFEIDEDGNAKNVFYTYVDSEVTISGYTERKGAILYDFDADKYIDIFPVYWEKITTTYKVNWKEGWNFWNSSYFYDIQERTVTGEWTNTNINKLKWYGSEDDLWKINLNRK